VTWHFPDVWTFILLALAAYRLYRLGARDTITEPVRAALTYPDEQALALGDDVDPRLEVVGERDRPKGWRVYLATLIRCPWCAGFYVSVCVWVAWELEPRWSTICAAPWALSAVLGLVRKNLDA
jgi:hypothetical protein